MTRGEFLKLMEARMAESPDLPTPEMQAAIVAAEKVYGVAPPPFRVDGMWHVYGWDLYRNDDGTIRAEPGWKA